MAWAMARAAKTSPPGLLIRSSTSPAMARSSRAKVSAEIPPSQAASASEATMTSYTTRRFPSARKDPRPRLAWISR